MQTNSFVLEHKLKFLGNGGSFNEQPIFTLVQSNALTGNNFISVGRIRKSTNDGASGVIYLKIGTTAGLSSITGSQPLYCQSHTADSGASTSDSTQYIISTAITDFNKLNVIINDLGIYSGDASLTGFERLGLLNYFGTGIRPISDSLPTNGVTGSSLILYYTYNREELSSSLTSIVDRSGNSLSAAIKGAASGNGTSATVTGFTYAPCEGGFRFDGKSWLESASSSLFNPVSTALSGISIMCFVKFAATSNSQILTIGSGITETFGLKEDSGVLKLQIGNSSFTAGSLNLGKWYHIAATFDGSMGSFSGANIYINGACASYSAFTSIPQLIANSRLVIGKALDLSNSGLTGVIGLTRIFNRCLSATEIMQNYLSEIPSQVILKSVKIG